MKTFPLILTDEQHKEMKLEAYKRGQTLKEFIMGAIMIELNTKGKSKNV